MDASDLAVLQNEFKNLKEQVTAGFIDIKEDIKAMYIELRLLRDGYLKKTEFVEYRSVADEVHKTMATKEELREIADRTAWNSRIIWAAVVAIIGIAFRIFDYIASILSKKI